VAPPRPTPEARAALTLEAACSLPLAAPPTPARPGAQRFSAPEGSCKSDDGFCDTADLPPAGADACFVATANLRASGKRAAGTTAGPATASAPWDGVQRPKWLDRIDAHLHLQAAEHALLRKNGFVVLDRIPYADYASAFHDIFQEELPLYVGVDPILHAVFRATEVVLERVEQKRLGPALTSLIGKLQRGLLASRLLLDETTRKDLDVYLAVAAELAALPRPQGGERSLFGQQAAVEEILGALRGRQLAPVAIFGRERMIDASAFEPRGHYEASSFVGSTYWDGRSYFEAVTWLSRFEWNLVSRDCRSSQPGESPDPHETPREARDALALAELVQRSGALPELRAFDEVYAAFAGRREDASVPDLLDLMKKGGFSAAHPAAPEKLGQAIGAGFRRTARVHFMPQDVKNLPVIATLLGPRVAPDTAPLTGLVHDAVPGRTELGAADVAYVLGHDRARPLLARDLEAHPGLAGALDQARAALAAGVTGKGDVQTTFLRMILALAQKPAGIRPSFMDRDAHADLRMSSALVGYAQLRHTFILTSGQGYDAYGCAIPGAYVEPLAAFYEAAIAHVEGMRKVVGGFDGLLRVLSTLRAIARTELASGAPTPAQAEWLAMVAEFVPNGGLGGESSTPPKWTGWYFDMFEDREIGATRATDVIADYFTLTNAGQVAYLGADGPRLGVFVVDTGGGPRALVGPVAHGYELHAPLGKRLDDGAARGRADKRAPFRASFAAEPPPEPPLGLTVSTFECPASSEPDAKVEVRVVLASERALGPVTVTVLDHHGDPIAPAATQDVGEGLRVFAFAFPGVRWFHPGPARFPDQAGPASSWLVEALSVRVEDLSRSGLGRGPYDFAASPSVFLGKGYEVDGLPTRPRGVGPFVLGARRAAAPAE
jgi:hypothetical protein